VVDQDLGLSRSAEEETLLPRSTEDLRFRAAATEEARIRMWIPGPGLITLAGTYGPWSLHVNPA
jgi:hypothetical protein